MLEACGELDLEQESRCANGGGDFRSEDFECDSAVVLQVMGQVDHGHAAATELPLDRVLAGERRLQVSEEVVQRQTSQTRGDSIIGA